MLVYKIESKELAEVVADAAGISLAHAERAVWKHRKELANIAKEAAGDALADYLDVIIADVS